MWTSSGLFWLLFPFKTSVSRFVTLDNSLFAMLVGLYPNVFGRVRDRGLAL